MNHPLLVSIFLAGAVVVVLGGCLGLLLMRNALARLHYLGPVTLLAPVFVAAAVLAEEGLSQAGLKALLVAAILLLQGPVLAHILGRAIALRQKAGPRNGAEGTDPARKN